MPSPETPTPQTDIPQTDAVELPDTEVIAVPRPDLVFVDATGRRRRVLRRASYGFAAVCVAYGGLVGVSLAGGPVSTSAVLPFPNLAQGDPETPKPSAAATSTAPPTVKESDRATGRALAAPVDPVGPRATVPKAPVPRVTPNGPVLEAVRTPTGSPSPGTSSGSPSPDASSSTTAPSPSPTPSPAPTPAGGTGGGAPNGRGRGSTGGTGGSSTGAPATETPATEGPTTETPTTETPTTEAPTAEAPTHARRGHDMSDDEPTRTARKTVSLTVVGLLKHAKEVP